MIESERLDLERLYTRLLDGVLYDDYDEASRLIGVLRRHLDNKNPDPMSQALNEGDGTYRP